MKGNFFCFFESQAVKHDANGRSIRMKNSRANDFLDQKGAIFNLLFSISMKLCKDCPFERERVAGELQANQLFPTE